MTRLLLVGSGGRMGKTIEEMASNSKEYKVVAGIDLQENPANSYPVYSSFDSINTSDIDVVIDFSNPSLLASLLGFVTAHKLPVVIATTGLSSEDIGKVEEASRLVPIFRSGNMSLGVNVMIELCKRASQALGTDYDVEIVEKHHNKKVDAPSGTALMLADGVNSVNSGKYEYIYDRSAVRRSRDNREIGIQSVRGGNIVGEHEVMFIGDQEILTIGHSAGSRAVFAQGALKAAGFIKGKEAGLYDMTQLVAEVL